MAIIHTAKVIKYQVTISRLTIKIKKLKEKRARAYDDKIARLENQRANEVKKLTAMGVPVVAEDCDDKKTKPKAKPKPKPKK